MGFTAILGGIVAFAKAIPAVQKIVNQFVDLYLNAMDDETAKYFSETKEGRNYAIKKIEVAASDEQIIDGFNDLIGHKRK